MKIYVHDDKTAGLIAKACKGLDVSVLTAQDVRGREFDAQAATRKQFFLDEVDALILEITRPTQDIHFIIAQAIIARIPVLCLYGKNQAPRELLAYIKKGDAGKRIKTFSYLEEQLAPAVTAFIYRHDPEYASDMDIPEIKFTLRLTKRTNEYLAWEAKRTGKTKADLLRDIVQEQALANDQFLKTQEKPKKLKLKKEKK